MHRLKRSTAIASLLGVKFGVSQMISHAGGGNGSRLVGVGTSQLLRVGTSVLGGEIRNNASSEMKNNVIPIMETP